LRKPLARKLERSLSLLPGQARLRSAPTGCELVRCTDGEGRFDGTPNTVPLESVERGVSEAARVAAAFCLAPAPAREGEPPERKRLRVVDVRVAECGRCAREELGPSFSSDRAAVVGVEDEPATVCVGEPLHKSLGVRASFGLGVRITTGAQGVEEIATVASVALPCKGHKVRERVPRTQYASQGEHEQVELHARAYEQRGRGCFGERAGECEGDFRADADAGVDERQPRRGVACRTRVQLELKPADSEPPTSGRRPDPHGHQPFRPRETDRGVTEFVDEHEHRSAREASAPANTSRPAPPSFIQSLKACKIPDTPP
jgi:hypothetical protein